MNQNRIVYAFTRGELAVLGRLQMEVMRAISQFLEAHEIKFDPNTHEIDWPSGCVVAKEESHE